MGLGMSSEQNLETRGLTPRLPNLHGRRFRGPSGHSPPCRLTSPANHNHNVEYSSRPWSAILHLALHRLTLAQDHALFCMDRREHPSLTYTTSAGNSCIMRCTQPTHCSPTYLSCHRLHSSPGYPYDLVSQGSSHCPHPSTAVSLLLNSLSPSTARP